MLHATGEAYVTDSVRSFGLLAWAVTVLAILAMNIAMPLSGMENTWMWIGGLMAFPVAGLIVMVRRPGNRIGQLLGLIATIAGLQFGLAWFCATFLGESSVAYADIFAASSSVMIFGAILGVFHLFPTGTPINDAHRRFLTAVMSLLGVAMVLSLIRPGAMESGRQNPLGVGPDWVVAAVDGAFLILPITALVGIVVLVVRHRRATPLERAQLRWFFVGAAGLTITFGVLAFFMGDHSPLVDLLFSVMVLLGFWALPAAIVVAVLRYRLYDIDRVLSRTVSYVVIAGVVAGVYGLSVLALQLILPVGGSQVVVAASTLGAAAAFAPVRRVVQERLDRRFNRARYEAGVVAQEFSRRLQREFDAELIKRDLAAVIDTTMHPAAVTVWLRS